jgi:hypothetical protein
MAPDQLARAQRAFESEGARLLQVQREIRLVLEVLREQAARRPAT